MSRATRAQTAHICVLLAALTACSDGDDRVAELEREVRSLRASIEKIEARVATAELEPHEGRGRTRVASAEPGSRGGGDVERGGSDGVAAVESPTDPSAAGAGAGGEEESPAQAELQAEAARLERVFGTEAGREALDRAMRGVEDRRERQRRQRVAHAVVGVFSQQADLSREQAGNLSRLLTSAADEIQDLWAGVRARGAGAGTGDREGASGMGSLVQDSVRKTVEIRRTANEKAREFLSDDQYARFLEQADRLHNSLRPGDAGRQARESIDRPRENSE